MKQSSQLNGYTLTKLSQMFDANRETMRRRLELVKPLRTGGKGRGGGNHYTLKQVLDAYCTYERQAVGGSAGRENLDAGYEKARKDKEYADKTALENKVRRGELLEADDVRREWSDQIVSVKSSLRSLPAKLTPVVAPEDDPARVNELLLGGIDEALEELAE